jgi:hypothetical protein
MITFNIFNKIDEVLNLYDNVFEKYNNTKLNFEKEIFDEWEYMMNIFEEIINEKSEKTSNEKNEYIFSTDLVIDQSNNKNQKKEDNTYQREKFFNIFYEKEKIIKRIYRKIAIKTHPDKVNDKKKIEFFKRAKTFHDNQILIGIIFIAKKLDININIQKFHEKIIIEMLREISLVQEKINKIKTSIYWKWYNEDNLSNKYRYKETYAKKRNLKKK